MHIWTIEKWIDYLDYDAQQYRTGLRLKSDKNVDPEVRRACKEFCKWLRTEYFFPVRIPIYLKGKKQIKAMDGEFVSATFFGPYDLKSEPYIRVSTGDYEELLDQRGRDNALVAILHSIAHELTHYFQWINGIELTPVGEERQATMYARYILDEYAETRGCP